MNPQISSDTFDSFFAWAPWVIGAAIYFAFYVAKRHEIARRRRPRTRGTDLASVRRLRAARDRATQMVPQRSRRRRRLC